MTAFLIFLGLSPLILWGHFLAVMALKRARDEGKMSPEAALVGKWGVLLPGWVTDFFVNCTWASALFLEPPMELTVTARLSRHIEQRPTHWRGRLALYITSRWLDAYDPAGLHR